jgi:hypothetical protein
MYNNDSLTKNLSGLITPRARNAHPYKIAVCEYWKVRSVGVLKYRGRRHAARGIKNPQFIQFFSFRSRYPVEARIVRPPVKKPAA